MWTSGFISRSVVDGCFVGLGFPSHELWYTFLVFWGLSRGAFCYYRHHFGKMWASFAVLGGFLDSLGSSLGPWGRHKSDLCGLGLRLLRIPPSLRSFVFEVQWGRIQIFIFFKVSSEIIFDVWQAEIEVITSSISDLVAQLGE